MPDLDLPLAAERDASLAREALPSPAAIEPGSPDRARGVFEAAFDRAYDLPGAPDRGERVLADVQLEARTFGDVWTLRALDAEGFGRAADPVMNDVLVDTLQTGVGRETVLHALKDGAPTPGTGADLVVLLDREGAAGFGHTAVLIGNDHEGWTLHSKDGSSWAIAVVGPSTWTNGDGQGRRSGDQVARFETLDDFFRDAGNEGLADRYEAAVRVEFEAGDDLSRGDKARAGANAIIREPYDILSSSCAHTVERALQDAGIEGHSLQPSMAFRGAILPKTQFRELGEREGADDVKSDAQIAWEQRSAFDGR